MVWFRRGSERVGSAIEVPDMKISLRIPGFRLGWALVLTVIVAGLTLYFWKSDTQTRELIRFAAGGAGVAAAVLAAIYIGENLRSTVKQREEAAAQARTLAAFNYAARWNDPRLAPIRKSYSKAKREIKDKTSEQINSYLEEEGNENLKSGVYTVLNLFEELAIAVNMEVADEEVVRRTFRTILCESFDLLSDWLIYHRRSGGQERIRVWREAQKLYNKWKELPPDL